MSYGDFVRIDFEWTAERLWKIPFPGFAAMGEYRSPADYGMPRSLAARVLVGQASLDSRDPFLYPEQEDFGYAASGAEGLAVAGEVKLFLGEDHYVELRAFREIAIRRGGAVELEALWFIADLSL